MHFHNDYIDNINKLQRQLKELRKEFEEHKEMLK